MWMSVASLLKNERPYMEKNLAPWSKGIQPSADSLPIRYVSEAMVRSLSHQASHEQITDTRVSPAELSQICPDLKTTQLAHIIVSEVK